MPDMIEILKWPVHLLREARYAASAASEDLNTLFLAVQGEGCLPSGSSGCFERVWGSKILIHSLYSKAF
ncbi:MAG: hypothetical protein ACFCU4_04090 [Puniceicoccaceae bacterium]